MYIKQFCFIHGNDYYETDKIYSSFITDITKKYNKSPLFLKIDAQKDSVNEILEESLTPTFDMSPKFFWVKNYNIWIKNKSFFLLLNNALEYCYFIFSLDDTVKLVNSIDSWIKAEKKAIFHLLKRPSQNLIYKRISEFFKNKKIRIDQEDLLHIAQYLAQEPIMLKKELEKIELYSYSADEKEDRNKYISQKELSDLLFTMQEGDLFAVAECFWQSDSVKLFSAVINFIKKGGLFLNLHSVVKSDFQKVYYYKTSLDETQNREILFKSIGVIHPFLKQKIQKRVSLFTENQLKNILNCLFEIEINMKTTHISNESIDSLNINWICLVQLYKMISTYYSNKSGTLIPEK